MDEYEDAKKKELTCAIMSRDIDKVTALLSEPLPSGKSLDPNFLFEYSDSTYTPLHFSCGMFSHPGITEVLLKYRANPNMEEIITPFSYIFNDFLQAASFTRTSKSAFDYLDDAIQNLGLLAEYGSNLNVFKESEYNILECSPSVHIFNALDEIKQKPGNSKAFCDIVDKIKNSIERGLEKRGSSQTRVDNPNIDALQTRSARKA